MQVIGIVGSPRMHGNTEMLTAHALKAVAEEGLATDLIRLAGLDIRPCNACMVCTQEEWCSIEDDFFNVYLKMKEARGIIIASPVYYGSATALVKALIERAGHISRHNGEPLCDKVGGALVTGRRAGHNFTLAQLTLWFQILGFVVPGSNYWSVAFGEQKGDVLQDEEGMETSLELWQECCFISQAALICLPPHKQYSSSDSFLYQL